MAKLCRKLKWLVFFWDTVYFSLILRDWLAPEPDTGDSATVDETVWKEAGR